jgi:AcrR family transcriptional regulator
VDLPVKAAPGRRQRKAQVTRARVLDSAEALFIRDGYAATTITAIAEEADVAVQTVYAVFGNKRAILTELLAARVVGDDKPAPLRERRDWQALEAEADPVRQLELLAWTAARIGSRIADLYVVMAAAAASDPEIADAYQRQQQARYADQQRLARSLAQKNALRAGLTQTHATDIIWTLANPHTYRTLVSERGWSPDDYQLWLTDILACSLLMQPRPEPEPA